MLELFSDLPSIKVPKYRRTHQITNFERPLDWRPREHLAELDGVYALDLETLDPGLAADKGSSWYKADEGFVTGIGVGDKHDQFYLPIGHSNGNVDPDRAWRWLATQAAKPNVSFVYANAPYDLGWLSKRHGIEFANAPYDVQAMAALLDETRFSYSLDTLGNHYLDRGKNDDDLIKACISGGLRDPMSRMDLVPAWLAEKYGLNDISLTIDLFHHLMPMIQRDGLANVLELERECALVAVDMKALGVRIDLDRADKLRTDFKARRAAALAKIHELTGVRTSASDLQSLIRALKVEQPAVELPTTANGSESIAKGVLDALPTSPVIDAIREARELDKAVGTFIESYLFGHEYRGRIHADFNPLRRADEKGSGGATGGRWACVAKWTPIKTSTGLKRIDEVRVGDQVWTHKNRWRPVTHTWIKGWEPMLDIHLSNGEILTCTKKHRLLLANRKWITAGELYERVQKLDKRSTQHSDDVVPLSRSSIANDGADCGRVGIDISECGVCIARPPVNRGAYGSIDTALLSFEAWRQEPDDRQVGRRASQLEGGDFGSERLSHGENTWRQTKLRPSQRSSEDGLRREIAAAFGSASHRRERGEQRPRQHCDCHKERTQNYPRLAAPRGKTISITAIHAGPSREVFDLTIDEDHSYEAVGCFSHNSQNPNLQNIPVRTAVGLEVRKCFIPEPGEVWAKFDYASQEPRLLIHFADITRVKGVPLKGAADMVRRFRENPLTDLHLQTALLMFGHTPETWEMLDKALRKALRGRSKTINLAIAYGAGGGNICDQLGLPTVMKEFTKDGRKISYRAAGPEGQALLDRHFKAMPFLKQLQGIAKERAEEKHMIRTISGRIIRFQSFGGQLLRPHKALNAVVQGSAADQMKQAQVAFRKEKLPLLVAVHDEGDFSVPRGADAYIARIKAIMEDVLPLRVPVVAEVKVGENWGDVSVD